MEEDNKELQVGDGMGMCCCNCKQKLSPRQLFDDNVEDIAKSLAQVMLICGISTAKCCQARSIIKRSFVYHEKLRTQCSPNAGPESRLNRDDMLQALRIKCEMESVEAMLSYSIIKRAFKAFFHGKPPVTLSNPVVDAMAIHRQQPAWMHAAYKTSRIFDNYHSAFFWAHKSYEKQINAIYSALYSRMSARCNPLAVSLCPCRGCLKQKVPGAPTSRETRVPLKFTLKESCDLPKDCILCGLQVPPQMTAGSKVHVQLPRPIRNGEVNLPRCDECNSPLLICECNIDQVTGEQYGECGQDSYKVKWYRLEDEQPQPKPVWPSCEGYTVPGSEEQNSSTAQPTEDWENHHCPVDCRHDSCSEASNVCPGDVGSSNVCDDDDSSDGGSSYQSCTDLTDNMVDQLEDYLNKLWAQEVAEKKNPQTYVAGTIREPGPACKRCKD